MGYSGGMNPRAVLMIASLAAAGLTLTGTAAAKPYWMRGAQSNESDFLPPDEAFSPSAHVEGGVLVVRWVIADGYYLYRSRLDIRPESPDLTLDAPVLPPGARLTDAYLGSQEVYRQQVDATVGYHRLDYGAHPMQIKVFYQGCAQAGLCYPLLTKVIFPAQRHHRPGGRRRPPICFPAPAPGSRWPSWVVWAPS